MEVWNIVMFSFNQPVFLELLRSGHLLKMKPLGFAEQVFTGQMSQNQQCFSSKGTTSNCA